MASLGKFSLLDCLLNGFVTRCFRDDTRCFRVGEKEKYHIANRMFNHRHCHSHCMDHLSLNSARPIFISCINEIEHLSVVEKHEYLFQKLRSATTGFTQKGYLKCDYNLGVGIESKLHGVCRNCFTQAYDIGDATLDRIRAEVRMGYQTSDCGRRASESSNELRHDPHFIKLLCKQAERLGYSLDPRQVGAMAVPNTVAALSCYAWMHNHFDLVACAAPNSCCMELEPITLSEVHDEYLLDMVHTHESGLGLTAFCRLWKTCFQHVRIREFKAVTGKCHTCAVLGIARKTHRDRMSREHIKLMHYLHRSAFMNERVSYYLKREQGKSQPKKYLSIITDGMAQSHCLLPWMGNVDQSDNLPQHFQGVYAHGRFLQFYRTFHNVLKGANQHIHALLMALERVEREEGRIPDTIYFQIDGGAENISKTVLAMCELLVARGITKKIVLSRLMVGHTHEDIDGKFALIWRRIRSAYCLTMSEYKDEVEKATTTQDGIKSEVIDLFAVIDFDAYLRPAIDAGFGRYAKRIGENDWSVLQFTFVAEDDENLIQHHFPLGVRTFYQQYCNPTTFRIVKDSHSLCGMTSDELRDIRPFPPAYPDEGLPEGMCIMQHFPRGQLKWEEFVGGSRAELETICHKIIHQFVSDVGTVVHGEWTAFRDEIAPQSDDVNEFLALHPEHGHIPLPRLFQPQQCEVSPSSIAASRKRNAALKRPDDRSTVSVPLDYVKRSSKKWKVTDLETQHSSKVVEGPRGVAYAIPVTCQSVKKKKSAVSAVEPEVEPEVEPSDSSSVDSNSTDSNDDDNGWLVCRKAHLVALPHAYGTPADFVGKEFTVPNKYLKKAFFAEKCSTGKIANVVRRVCQGDEEADEELYFKIYNNETYPDDQEPDAGSHDWQYVPCKQLMSASNDRRMITWKKVATTADTQDKSTKRAGRKRKQTWAFVTDKPKALYDDNSSEEETTDYDHGPRTRHQREHHTHTHRPKQSRKSVPVVQSQSSTAPVAIPEAVDEEMPFDAAKWREMLVNKVQKSLDDLKLQFAASSDRVGQTKNGTLSLMPRSSRGKKAVRAVSKGVLDEKTVALSDFSSDDNSDDS
jgi:hypothetical protein